MAAANGSQCASLIEWQWGHELLFLGSYTLATVATDKAARSG